MLSQDHKPGYLIVPFTVSIFSSPKLPFGASKLNISIVKFSPSSVLSKPTNLALKRVFKWLNLTLWLTPSNFVPNLDNVFLINKVQRQEIVGKKIFEINDKYYFSDLGIRNMLVGWYKPQDIGKILENIVFLHFKALGYQIFVGKNQEKEIDFVVEKNGDKKYLQVTYLLSEEAQKREFKNLIEIPDNYEKIVLTLDDFAWWDWQGIKCYNIMDYLML